MEEIGANVAITCADRLVDLGIKTLPYLCYYNSYVEEFKRERGKLSAEMESVRKDIEVAKTRKNETEVDDVVENWLQEGENIIQKDTKPKKWFGLCVNFFSQCSRAMELERLTTKDIPRLIDQRKGFTRVARSARAPGIAYHSQEFMYFESRRLKFERLLAVLRDENNHMIGLQGIGGAGKTTMAIEVGQQVESKSFGKVIFISVSTLMDEKRIRDDIAKQLELQLEEEKQVTHAQQIWTRIVNAGKVLIILDDVWEKLDLKNIGIQPGFHSTGTCNVLLTTRYANICTQMGCQKSIQLGVLPKKDALNLFLSHALEIGQDCLEDSKKVALDIVIECGRLPVIIVAVAKTLRNWHPNEWHHALIALKKKLETLELINCSIIELPSGISELDNLRFLGLMRCLIERNNPFEVIERCLQLEELYYVLNEDYMAKGGKDPQITFLPEYQRYHIDGSKFSTFYSAQLDTSIKKCFKPGELQFIFSKQMIKSLAARAEILELEVYERGWSNLIPDIVSIDDHGAMNDLIKLSLKSWLEVKCLIHTEHLQLEFGVTIFSKLVELQLDIVGVRELCHGRYPTGFLKQLQKLELKACQKLEGTLFKGKLELGNLKSIEIVDCSMICLFHPSTAQTLKELETFKINECSELKYIMRDEGSSREEKKDEKDLNPWSHDLMFPKLKHLDVKRCSELEFILPICLCEDLPLLESMEISECQKIKYIFGQYSREGGLYQLKKEIILHSLKVMSIEDVSEFVDIYPECYLPKKSAVNTSEVSKVKDKSPTHNVSWGPLCCFMSKSSTTNEDDLSMFKATQLDPTTSQALKEEKYVGNIAHGIFTPPLYPFTLREMKMGGITKLTSMFSVSIASSLKSLEKLEVRGWDALEHIITDEGHCGHDHMNANSIFPNLYTVEIYRCDKLESIFPASCSTNLLHLQSVLIEEARELKYVFGKSYGDDDLLRHQS
ncbi:uncharacterized protein LOC129285611 [Prosopis cineraria]|uniref:uncharacterized protein LOC129285611 n=1 Tax=Prosopis cineraria TaxID=364024 RepID=UPI00240EC38A|nr:uncharacterized protein LOC129285611 [Prosopis cineraria]